MRPREDNFKAVVAAFAEVKGENDRVITELTTIDDLGLDSLDFIDLAYEIEKLTESRLDFVKLQKWQRGQTQNINSPMTVKDLLDFLEVGSAAV